MKITIISGFIRFQVQPQSEADQENLETLLDLEGVTKTEDGCAWDLDILTKYAKKLIPDFSQAGTVEIGGVYSTGRRDLSLWPKDEAATKIVEFLKTVIHKQYNLSKLNPILIWCRSKMPYDAIDVHRRYNFDNLSKRTVLLSLILCRPLIDTAKNVSIDVTSLRRSGAPEMKYRLYTSGTVVS